MDALMLTLLPRLVKVDFILNENERCGVFSNSAHIAKIIKKLFFKIQKKKIEIKKINRLMSSVQKRRLRTILSY